MIAGHEPANHMKRQLAKITPTSVLLLMLLRQTRCRSIGPAAMPGDSAGHAVFRTCLFKGSQ
jgi:hypothetical protein